MDIYAQRSKARLGNVADDYLKYTRTPPLSRFEIKAGWEIPAALERVLSATVHEFCPE